MIGNLIQMINELSTFGCRVLPGHNPERLFYIRGFCAACEATNAYRSHCTTRSGYKKARPKPRNEAKYGCSARWEVPKSLFEICGAGDVIDRNGHSAVHIVGNGLEDPRDDGIIRLGAEKLFDSRQGGSAGRHMEMLGHDEVVFRESPQEWPQAEQL
jgi:hypothetical protein